MAVVCCLHKRLQQVWPPSPLCTLQVRWKTICIEQLLLQHQDQDHEAAAHNNVSDAADLERILVPFDA